MYYDTVIETIVKTGNNCGTVEHLDGWLGRLLWLKGLDQRGARLQERRAAGDLCRGGGGGGRGGRLSRGERRGERQRLRGQSLGGGEADAGALVDLRGGCPRRLWGWSRRARGGAGSGVHLVLEQVREIPHLVADKLQHL